MLILAECTIKPATMLEILNPSSAAEFHYAPGRGCRKIEVYTRFPSEFLEPVRESRRITIRRLALPGRREILLAAAHLWAKRHLDEARVEQSHLTHAMLARLIQEAEAAAGHSRTVLIGDLNMNPFEPGMVGALTLNAVRTRRLAVRRPRRIEGLECPYFYNPMWGFFRESPQTPPGSHYYDKGGTFTHYWNIYDQVLVRPDLLPWLRKRGVRILESDGTESLLSARAVPDREHASDHLPILFRLAL